MKLRAVREWLGAAWREATPSFEPLAVAPIIGALPVTTLNALAIWLLFGSSGGLERRACVHVFDAVETLAVAGWLALPPALLAWLYVRREDGRLRLAMVGMGLIVALATLGMQAILGDHFRRQADAALDGTLGLPLRVLMTFGSGLGVVLAGVVGVVARRRSRRAAWLVALAALSALVTNHLVLRDDYANVHAGVTWAAMMGFGAPLAEPVTTWLRSHRGVMLGLVAVIVAGTFVAPPNEVRLELFRECGTSASWVLAQTMWAAPSSDATRPSERPPASSLLGHPRLAARHEPLVPSPVVVLLTIDALRADVLTDRERAKKLPHLSRLARHGLYVPRAVSAGSQTAVSLAALFSGRSFSSQRWTLHGSGQARFLYPATDPTERFPERLAREGIRSEGFLALQFLAGDFGVTRGFTREHMLTEGRRHAPATAVMPPLLAALDALRPDEPLLLFAHLTEPHEPYDRGALREGAAFDRYLSEIEVVDGWIGRVVKRLEERARGRGYLLVTADHGEAFGEHGTTFHTKTLYEELLRVPLIVWGPKVRARRCDAPASVVDLGPTVLDLYGLEGDPEGLGTTLLPLALAERACDAARPPPVAEGRMRRAFFLANGVKVIEDLRLKTVEVYDLQVDPEERTNLFGRDPRSAEAVAAARAHFARTSLPGVDPPFKP